MNSELGFWILIAIRIGGLVSEFKSNSKHCLQILTLVKSRKRSFKFEFKWKLGKEASKSNSNKNLETNFDVEFETLIVELNAIFKWETIDPIGLP